MGPVEVWAKPGRVAPWRWLQRRAATSSPLPPYPDPPPRLRPGWQRWGALLIGAAAVGAALGELAYRLGGGIFLWLFLGFVVPLAVVVNRYGVLRRPKSPRRTWRDVTARRPGG